MTDEHDTMSPLVQPVSIAEAKKLIYQEWENKVQDDDANPRLLVAYQIAMKALEEVSTWQEKKQGIF